MLKWTDQKYFLFFLCFLFVLGCATSKKYVVDDGINEAKASGRIDVKIKETALAIGKITGTGVLTYEGTEYPFKMSGMDYGSISKINFTASGNIFHLDDLDEFEGLYFQAKASLSVAGKGGGGVFYMNKHGVTIHVSSKEEKGFDFTLGRGGVKIKFVDE